MTGPEWGVVTFGVVIAGAMWAYMFRLETRDLWPRTWVAAGVLSAYGVGATVALGDGRQLIGPISPVEVLIGLAVGIGWLAATHLGAAVLGRVWPSFLEEVSDIYRLGGGNDPARVVGPLAAMAAAEELLFRGLIQARVGLLVGVAVYAAVQVVQGKRALVLAAAACGVVWGGLFDWRHGLVAPFVAHAVWTICLTVVCPIARRTDRSDRERQPVS